MIDAHFYINIYFHKKEPFKPLYSRFRLPTFPQTSIWAVWRVAQFNLGLFLRGHTRNNMNAAFDGVDCYPYFGDEDGCEGAVDDRFRTPVKACR